ncbi:MAG TPA: tetratricopeptide repeat protein [Blastocatellia bacterium]|nr:tetratricopeptide repeat protein [Blastocatellia bacterium]
MIKADWPWQAGAIALALVCVLAYANSFQGVFVFDDVQILRNAHIRQLWPPWPALFAPENINRPLVSLSLAINYAISGYEVWSYHLFNLLIHLAASLCLFGVVRRTLLGERLRERFGPKATALALVVALVWAIHPLQTQSVTYIIQRGESLMGLFYLLTLYCAVRSFEAVGERRWATLAIAACAGGMLSKQVMLTAPLMVWLYDYVFVSGSLTLALRRRWPLYAGLAATWGAAAMTVLAAPSSSSAGFGVQSVTPWHYFVSQFGVIAHYLRLAVWPSPLVLDYEWPVARTAAEVIPYAILIGALAAASLWALIRRHPLGYAGAWFFVVLSLTSSFMPIADLAFEHRMYLPLAGVVALVVLGGYGVGERFFRRLPSPEQRQLARPVALALCALVVTSFAFLTAQRNLDYQNAVAMWKDVVSKRPGNVRAHVRLGQLLADQGRLDEALVYFDRACALSPRNEVAQSNLGAGLTRLGRLAEGEAHLLEAVRLRPHYADATCNLGRNLAAQGRLDEALDYFNRTLANDAQYPEVYFEIGLVMEKQGKFADAVANYRKALAMDDEMDGVLARLALLLATQDDPSLRNPDEAIKLAAKAVNLTAAQHPVPMNALATAYAEAGRFREAVAVAQRAFEVASTAGDEVMAATLEDHLRLYRAGRARAEAPLMKN